MSFHETIIILEDLEPILEPAIKQIAFEEKLSVNIKGKSLFSQHYDNDVTAIAQILRIQFQIDREIQKSPLIPHECQEVNPQLDLMLQTFLSCENE